MDFLENQLKKFTSILGYIYYQEVHMAWPFVKYYCVQIVFTYMTYSLQQQYIWIIMMKFKKRRETGIQVLANHSILLKVLTKIFEANVLIVQQKKQQYTRCRIINNVLIIIIKLLIFQRIMHLLILIKESLYQNYRILKMPLQIIKKLQIQFHKVMKYVYIKKPQNFMIGKQKSTLILIRHTIIKLESYLEAVESCNKAININSNNQNYYNSRGYYFYDEFQISINYIKDIFRFTQSQISYKSL
ncbi:unnamed protein product [Paramecium pentaurelia]|uniref:Transmembrane protein n=1 Tax=Paramecium pentaurelia TaxID=43138 RepID=A0A8S1S2J3_9CILI|nr:unnamed protein product [Paramecium pentaurelia]